MPGESSRIVFISHADADRQCADEFGEWLSAAFAGLVQVFWSSKLQSVQLGALWWDQVMEAIDNCTLGLVLVTENSLPRPWINYEVGALAALKKPIVPVCLGPIRIETLPQMLQRWQACSYNSQRDRERLLRTISHTLGLPDRFADVVAERARTPPEILVSSRVLPRWLKVEEGSPLGRLFPVSDRWTTLIYTCRSTFTGEACPSSWGTGSMRHAVASHVPVDELRTVSMALAALTPRTPTRQEDDVIHTVLCSKVAEEMVEGKQKPSDGLPHLLDRDLIVVGENNFSNLLLHLVEPHLPWTKGVRFVTTKPTRPGRPSVRVQLTASEFEEAHRGQIPAVEEGGGLISIFPSPFNIHRRVLSVYGCHRAGQYTLENWLRGQEIASVADFCESQVGSGSRSMLGVQVVVDGGHQQLLPGAADPTATGSAVPNMNAGGQVFWSRQLGPAALIGENPQCIGHDDMYDVSVIVRLSASESERVNAAVPENVKGDYLYWEAVECDIGLHVTLFEFLTHERPEYPLLSRLERLTEALVEQLDDSELRGRRLPSHTRVRGLELGQRALIAYVDFMSEDRNESNWLSAIRGWCERGARRAIDTLGENRALLNRMRVPFLPHVTVCRFSHQPQVEHLRLLRKLSDDLRQRELIPAISAGSVELVVARRQPYRHLSTRKRIIVDGLAVN